MTTRGRNAQNDSPKRLDAWERAHGPLELRDGQHHAARPADEEMPERTGSDVLRHIGGAEIWLAGRLTPDARYEGPPRFSYQPMGTRRGT